MVRDDEILTVQTFCFFFISQQVYCSLEGFIQATEMIPQKPDWDWDDVVKQIIDFWLGHEENIQQWKRELTTIGQESLIVARVANIDGLRRDFEFLI